MCCNRRNRNRPGPARMLAQVALDKYSARQDQKQLSAANVPGNALVQPSEVHLASGRFLNNKNLEEKSLAQPPSYEAAIEDSIVLHDFASKHSRQGSRADDGESSGSSLVDSASVDIVKKGTSVIGSDQQYSSWRQQKKAEKAARKAEKWADKARQRSYVY